MIIEKEMNEKWTANYIGAEGARMISEGLKSNNTLTILDLGGDEIEEWIDNENWDQNDRTERMKMNRQLYWSRRSENDKWRIEK